MRPLPLLRLALVLPLALTCCGKKDDETTATDEYEGTYQVTARTLNSAGCDVEGAATDLDPPYFQLSLEAASSGKALVYYKCSTAAACSTDVLTTAWYFDGKGDGKWNGVATAAVAQKTQGKCFISLTADEATLTGTELRMEKRTSTGEVDAPSGQTCNDATKGVGQIVTYAIEHKAQLTCQSLEVVSAVKAN